MCVVPASSKCEWLRFLAAISFRLGDHYNRQCMEQTSPDRHESLRSPIPSQIITVYIMEDADVGSPLTSCLLTATPSHPIA